MPGNAKFVKVVADELALTEKQRTFARHVADGKTLKAAAKIAGYAEHDVNSGGRVSQLMQHPRIVAYIQMLHAQNENISQMSRKKVLDGFLEAIEQAKMMAEPMTQIAGWREIGKLCGYYAPETKNINVNVSAQRVLGQFESLSDAELLQVIDSSAELLVEEAELAAEMLPSAQDVADGTQSQLQS